MDTAGKLEILTGTFSDKLKLEGLVDKLLEAALSQNRTRLQRYERDLPTFEERFGMDGKFLPAF